MEFTNPQRAEVLIEALPYIQKYNDKIVVVKYGGGAMKNDDLKHKVMGDIVLLSLIGVKVVLVHGGGPEITETLGKLGMESKFLNGLRVTDADTAKIVQMVLAGKTNKDLVSILQSVGGKAIGLCGIDGGMISATMKDENLGYVGEITDFDPTPVLNTLESGYIPVIATLGCDNDGNVYNINADTAAAKIAATLGAESLISLTDTSGILRDPTDKTSTIPVINVDEAYKLVDEGIISGGMIPKVDCCVNAVREGVKKVFIIDGSIPHSLIVEMLTDEGIGTMFH